jgi:membrane-associated PAP2 superfamily phosphatase
MQAAMTLSNTPHKSASPKMLTTSALIDTGTLADTNYPLPSQRWYIKQFIIGLTLTLLFTLTVEHSQLDVVISQWLYIQDGANSHWLVDKASLIPHLVFYTVPKRLLLLISVYMVAAWLHRVFQNTSTTNKAITWYRGRRWFRPLHWLSGRELAYLALAMIIVPTVTASLKAMTHVSCPNHLQLFGGDLAYLTIWQNILVQTPAKCFPAAHASTGFALYAWAFVPVLWRSRWRIVLGATCFAWIMGAYKMAIGDHFFSHTLVAMLLAWTLCAALAACLLRK